jgi:bifunctional aspartokinase / homoserine dehydrogenase 1
MNPIKDPQQPKTLVMKFGGTSVGTAQAMAQTVEIVQQAVKEWPRVVVITSALAKVTNILLGSASQAAQGDISSLKDNEERLQKMHYTIAEALVPEQVAQSQVKWEVDHLIAEFSSLCRAISVLGEATPRALDAVASLGERMCVRVLTAAVETRGVPAQCIESTRLIITDDRFQNAHPDFADTTAETRQVLEPLLVQGIVPVVTGFIGATSDGATTTLGRGGSDYTAGILGAVLPADEVWIWTDVDGVMSADPRVVPNAKTIAEISYREIAELAYFGAKVLHPKTIRPLVEAGLRNEKAGKAGIGLRICNTFNPQNPGTRLVADAPGKNGNGRISSSINGPNNGQNGKDIAKAVTAIRGQSLVTIEGRGMLGVPGVAARTFEAVASTGTSVSLISQASSEQSICFAIPSEAVKCVLTALEKAFAVEIMDRDIDRIWATEETAIITVVGAGMIHTPGVAGRIFSALGEHNVNVIAIAQGSSEVSISLMVANPDAEAAVKAVHELIIKS